MNKSSMGNMMKQMQQNLEEQEVEGSSGGGMVKVTANGKGDITAIKIDPEAVDKDDVEMLQDLILAAIAQAKEKAQEIQSEQMSSLTGGLNIPGLNLPF